MHKWQLATVSPRVRSRLMRCSLSVIGLSTGLKLEQWSAASFVNLHCQYQPQPGGKLCSNYRLRGLHLRNQHEHVAVVWWEQLAAAALSVLVSKDKTRTTALLWWYFSHSFGVSTPALTIFYWIMRSLFTLDKIVFRLNG